jgi:flagellar motor switch protein FliN/FliY
MAESVPGGIPAWVAETWGSRLAAAIELMTGELPQITWRAAESESPPGMLWWRQPFSLGPEAVISTGAPESSWLEIGRHALTSAGIESSEPADARNTFLEISSQAFSGLCQAVSERLGAAVSCENGTEAGPPEGGLFEIGLSIGTSALPLYVSVSPGWLDAFAAGPPAAASTPPDAAAEPPPRPPARESGQRNMEPNPLELVMEVELPVSVSFGRAELPLRDVLKLTTGSIVELNRALSDPVEVIVNNCVVARGEVVVIEGNYGVRIQEIVSRDKRLGALR